MTNNEKPKDQAERGLVYTLFVELPIACAKLVGIVIKSYTVGLPARINLWRYTHHLSKKNKQ